MKKLVVALILLVIGAGVGGGGHHLYSSFKAGAEIAEPEAMKDLTDVQIREGILSPHLKTRMDAVAQIGKLPEEPRRKTLLEALAAPYAPTRLTSLTALANDFPGHPDVIEALLTLAKDDPDADVQEAAFRGLVASGDLRVLDLAVEVLQSMDAALSVKLSAAGTLDRLTGRSSAATLSGCLEEAEAAADDLSMDWDEWLGENRDKLAWDKEGFRFK